MPGKTNSTATPSGPKGLPIVGNALQLLKDPLGFAIKVKEEFGPVAALRLGPRKLILLQSPAATRHVLWANGKQYPKPKLGMETLRPLLGQGIATLTDMTEWANARTFILPLFSAKMLQAYFEEAIVSIEEEKAFLKQAADQDAAINIYDWMHEATFRILIRTIFKDGIKREEIPELTRLFNDVTAYINVRYITLGLPIDWAIGSARRGKKALDHLNLRIFDLILTRRRQRRKESKDMLDVLLAATNSDGTPLSDAQVRDNCMTMLFGGHETTAGSVTWAWGLIANNPDKRTKLQTEIDLVLKDGPPKDYAALKQLKYTNMVFEEAMRLYPMFALLLREAATDDTIEGHQIQKGDLIAFSANTIQHDPAVWPDPESFLPERHDSKCKANREKGAYLPFSLGQRGCIGERMARMEGILLLALLHEEFEFDLDQGLPVSKVSMSIKPEGGMWMRVNRRH